MSSCARWHMPPHKVNMAVPQIRRHSQPTWEMTGCATHRMLHNGCGQWWEQPRSPLEFRPTTKWLWLRPFRTSCLAQAKRNKNMQKGISYRAKPSHTTSTIIHPQHLWTRYERPPRKSARNPVADVMSLVGENFIS